MQIIEKYSSYWAPLGGTLLFLLLGLLLWRSASTAAERSEKSIDWVRQYRKGGFPFSAETLSAPPIRWVGVVLVFLIAACFAVLYQMNSSQILVHNFFSLLSSRYAITRMVLSALGGTAVFLLVRTMFGSPLTGFLGMLLFCTAPRPDCEQNCLLAISLLFLVLYLRSGKAGFPAEFLYLASVLFFVLCLALWPGLIWLAPVLLVLHWYKLGWFTRHDELAVGWLLLSLLAALAAWAIILGVCALLRVFLHAGFRFYPLRSVDSVQDYSALVREFFLDMQQSLFQKPMRKLLLGPMMAAPVLGLGFWGLISAITQLRLRRSVPGGMVLVLTLAFAAAWLLTGMNILLLPLTLAACFLIRLAVAGKKTVLALLICLLGIACHVAFALGVWYLPMNDILQYLML